MPCRAYRGDLALANHPFWNIIMGPYHWHAARRREVVDDSEFADGSFPGFPMVPEVFGGQHFHRPGEHRWVRRQLSRPQLQA